MQKGNIREISFEDQDTSSYFLDDKVVGKTNDSKIDLGEIVRDVDELMITNDEAYHIHDPWSRYCIRHIKSILILCDI